MPVKRCTENGINGYKWGDRGKCYTYTNERQREQARESALRQGRAIESSKRNG